MIIRARPRFKKSYKRLPNQVKERAKEKENVFRQNPLHPALGTHKLHGKDENIWAFLDKPFISHKIYFPRRRRGFVFRNLHAQNL